MMVRKKKRKKNERRAGRKIGILEVYFFWQARGNAHAAGSLRARQYLTGIYAREQQQHETTRDTTTI